MKTTQFLQKWYVLNPCHFKTLNFVQTVKTLESFSYYMNFTFSQEFTADLKTGIIELWQFQLKLKDVTVLM